jgi:hypothetical protein
MMRINKAKIVEIDASVSEKGGDMLGNQTGKDPFPLAHNAELLAMLRHTCQQVTALVFPRHDSEQSHTPRKRHTEYGSPSQIRLRLHMQLQAGPHPFQVPHSIMLSGNGCHPVCPRCSNHQNQASKQPTHVLHPPEGHGGGRGPNPPEPSQPSSLPSARPACRSSRASHAIRQQADASVPATSA